MAAADSSSHKTVLEPDFAEEVVKRSNDLWWETHPDDLKFYQEFQKPVIFAKLYLLVKPLMPLKLTPLTTLVDVDEAMVCVMILPPLLDNKDACIIDKRARKVRRMTLATSVQMLSPHPWSPISIKDMVDKGFIYSRILKEGKVDDVYLVEDDVTRLYPRDTMHYWYKVQPCDGLSHRASPYDPQVHGLMDDPPKIVPHAGIQHGHITIVEEDTVDANFRLVTQADLQQPPADAAASAPDPDPAAAAAPLGGNKYSRKHKSTKRTKKQNKRNSRRNRRRYRTRNRR
jgi:hypothetical protein